MGDMDLTIAAVLLGILEGMTEFIPVSSTGHLILATEMFGYDPHQWKVFNVVIQLGAVCAVVVQYWRTFWAVGTGLLTWEPMSVRFVRNMVLAFLPAGFSFFLGVPTMLGGAALQMWDYREELIAGTGPVGWSQIAIGFTVAFLVALVVIRAFVAFVSKTGFAPFAWYRIAAGILAVWLLSR